MSAPVAPPGDEAVLGRVTDPTALDDEHGGIAIVETFAPRAWSGRRARLVLPRNVRCRGCGGGGCDDCGRSGAFRLPDDPIRRELEIAVPPFVEQVVAVRVPRPFGDDSPVRQLLVVVEERSEPDPRLTLRGGDLDGMAGSELVRPVEVAPPRSWVWIGVAAAVALIAALARLLAG